MKSNKKNKKLTVRFAKRLKIEMQQAIVNSDYGFHGKSRWLMEAIHLFIKQNNYVELVEHGVGINQAELSEVEAFYLDEETISMVKNALTSVRVKYPLFEGVQSAFIRASVTYKLMLHK